MKTERFVQVQEDGLGAFFEILWCLSYLLIVAPTSALVRFILDRRD